MTLSNENIIEKSLIRNSKISGEDVIHLNKEEELSSDKVKYPIKRLYNEVKLLLGPGADTSLLNELDLFKSTEYWNSTIDPDLILGSVQPTTVSESIIIFLRMANPNGIVKLGENTLQSLISCIWPFNNKILSEELLISLLRNNRLDIIKQNYEKFKTSIIELEPATKQIWIQYLAKYAKQKYAVDIINTTNYKQILLDIFEIEAKHNVNIAYESSYIYQVNIQLWILLAQSLEQRIDRKEDYEGDLKDPNIPYFKKIYYMLALLKLYNKNDYDYLKERYLGNNQSNDTITQKIADNPLAAGNLIKLENIECDVKILTYSVPKLKTLQPLWTTVMTTYFKWPAIQAALLEISEPRTLVELGIELNDNKYKDTEEYNMLIPQYLKKLYNMIPSEKECISNSIDLITKKYFSASSIKTLNELGVHEWMLYDALYTTRYASIDMDIVKIDYFIESDYSNV